MSGQDGPDFEAVTAAIGGAFRRGYTGYDMGSPSDDHDTTSSPAALYFFPEQEITEEELRQILEGDATDRRAWAISHLLRYAQWEDIWNYVSRDEVREIFGALDLPDNLRQAWARMLKIEAGVT